MTTFGRNKSGEFVEGLEEAVKKGNKVQTDIGSYTALSKRPIDVFDAAMQSGKIISERAKEYGEPIANMDQIAAMSAEISHCVDTSIRFCLQMIIMKLARLSSNPNHVDSAVDIAGYARIIAQLQTRNQSRE